MTEEIDRHDWLVVGIAERRFCFPSRNHPNWVTYTNTSSQRMMGVETEDENEPVYPDVVVLENQRVVMLAQVETETGINQDEALQWLMYSNLFSFLGNNAYVRGKNVPGAASSGIIISILAGILTVPPVEIETVIKLIICV